jgi:hypothetical protein
LPRLILTIVYLIFAVSYLYINFRDTHEYRKIIEKVGKLKSFRWSQAEQTNIDV